MAKKIDMQALRQQINELQIDKDLKHDLLAAINGKTTAKVRKRIGICKKIGKFLANPNKIV